MEKIDSEGIQKGKSMNSYLFGAFHSKWLKP